MTPTALPGCGEGDVPDVRRDLWGYGVRIVLVIIVGAGAGAPFQRHSEYVLQTLTPRALSPAPRFAPSRPRPFLRPANCDPRGRAVTHDTDFSRMRSLVIFA